MKDYLYILPSLVVAFWIVRIFLLDKTNKVQLFIVAGMLTALLAAIYGNEFALFTFPLFHLAVRQKTSSEGVTKWDWLVLLPSILATPYQDTLFFTILLCVQIVAISGWSIIAVRKYNSRLAEVYDTSSELSADDIGQVLIFIICTVVIILINFILPDYVTSLSLFQVIIALFLSVLQYFIGSYTYGITDNSDIVAELTEISEVPEMEVKTSEETCTKVQDDDLIRRVVEEKMYLDPTISLVSMAERLCTNRTYLSNSIHTCRNQNFSDFVNSMRINHFIETITAEGPNANVKDIVMQCGYSNLQSFYRNFSEIMKMTPKTWIAENLK